MELGDAPLLSSWAHAAADLFQSELDELAKLISSQQAQDEVGAGTLQARAEAEVDAALALRAAAQDTTSPLAPAGGGILSGTSALSSAKDGKGKKQQQQQHQQQQRLKTAALTVMAEKKAALAKERADMVATRLREMQLLRDKEPWRQLTNEYAHVIAETRRSLEPVREREHLEYDFFVSKPLETFTMDEIVGTRARNPVGPTTAEDAGDQLGHVTGGPSPRDFVIDAGVFAEEYNDFLSREYGYKPVLNNASAPPARLSVGATSTSSSSRGGRAAKGNTSDRSVTSKKETSATEARAASTIAAVDATQLSLSQQQQKLKTHRPGLGTSPPDFCCSHPRSNGLENLDGTDDCERQPQLASSLPPIHSGGVAGSYLPSADDVTAATHPNFAADGALSAQADRLASSLPQLPGLGTRAMKPEKRAAPQKKACTAAPASAIRNATAVAAAAAPATRKETRATGAALVKGIECSLKDRSLALHTCAGSAVTATVRFTNRNANPTKLRLKPSSHPWLRFQCTVVAPVAGSAGTTGRTAAASAVGAEGGVPDPTNNSYSVETVSLSCGGYMEVDVCFEPLDMSEPLVQTLLQVGVTREVNSRSAEGAQWAFYEVPVTCETVLPTFRLTRSDDEDAEGRRAKELTDTKTTSLFRATYASYGSQENNDFPPTFVLSSTTQRYTLRNLGSRCQVSVQSSSRSFSVSPAKDCATLLSHGDGMDVIVTFAPEDEGLCEAVMTVVVREADDRDGEGRVLATHTFPLMGLGVVPRVGIQQIGDQVLAPLTTEPEDLAALVERAVAKYIAHNTTPEMPVSIPVVVVNHSAVPLPYYWDLEAIAGYDDLGSTAGSTASEEDLVAGIPSLDIDPSVGVLPGNGATTTFHVRVIPHTAAPILSSLNLFLVGLPDAAAWKQAHGRQEDAQTRAPDPVILELLRKNKRLPSAYAALEEFAMPGAFPHGGEDVLADPYAVFKTCFQQPQNESTSASNREATFVTGFFLFAKPIAPRLEIMPPVLEEAVECLTGLPYIREVVLRNPSPCDLHFLWDPTEDAFSGVLLPGSEAWRAMEKQRMRKPGKRAAQDPPAEVELFCLPKMGTIPAMGSVTVKLNFTVTSPGVHTGAIGLFVPELDRGIRYPIVADGGEGAGHVVARRSQRVCQVHVRGVGPTVHVSTELLDFGLIEFGSEAEASFTVTNDNPVPVVFDLHDPLMREPPRFVFIPPSFRLSSGDSVEVTVYRKAASMEDAQTYFELAVRGGATIALETRATIQKPTMMLDAAIVNFGSVPEGVWQEGCFFLTNLSALDMPFTVEVAAAAAPNPCVELDLPVGTQTLRAGQKHCAVKVRARFTAMTAEPRKLLRSSADGTQSNAGADSEDKANMDAYRVLLGIRSKRKKRSATGATGAGQVLLLELCCDRVERLALSVDLLAAKYASTGGVHREGETGALELFETEADMPMADYIRTLLENLVADTFASMDTGASAGHGGQASRLGANRKTAPASVMAPAPSSATEMVTCPSHARGRGGLLPSPYSLRPYCSTRTLQLVLPDDSPVCLQEVAVRIMNHSGCLSSCAMMALTYAPLPIITTMPASLMGTGAGGAMTLTRNRSRRGSLRSARSVRSAALTTSGRATGAANPPHGSTLVTTAQAEASLVQEWTATRQPRFWTTAVNGLEERDRTRSAAFASAQQLLLDGRGCVATLRRAGAATTALVPTSEIGPHQSVMLFASLMANLPGRYEETLRLGCMGVPSLMEIPVSVEVRGKPVLLDPTTSGLTTTNEGHDVLVMPPTVACLGSSRRTLKIVNRAPRDLNVSVEMFVSGSTFAVTAVDDDVEASQVVLTLGPIPEAQVRQDRRQFGSATASPSSLFMPALSTKEVQLEYVPDLSMVQGLLDTLTHGTGQAQGQAHANARAPALLATGEDDEGEDDDRVKGAMSQEVDWEGSIVIQAELARSAFNDAFLMDEFYQTHRARYPSTRTLKILHRHPTDGDGGAADDEADEEESDSKGSADAHGASRQTGALAHSHKTSGVEGLPRKMARATAPMLHVLKPLITRPGTVVRNSKLMKPLPSEVILVEHALRKAESRAPSAAPGRKTPASFGSPTSVSRGVLPLGGVSASVGTLGTGGNLHTAGAGLGHGDAEDSSSDSDNDACWGAEAEKEHGGKQEDGGASGGAARKATAVVGSMANNPALQAAAESGTLRPVQELLAEDTERKLLLAHLESRHETLRQESLKYFSPIELLLRARCGVPMLAVQPSDKAVVFPPWHHAAQSLPCRRTIRLTNHNSAALYFALRLGDEDGAVPPSPSPLPFRVTEVKLVPQLVESTPLLEDDDESHLAQRALKGLKWGNKAEALRAERLLAAQQAKDAATRRGNLSAVFGTVRRPASGTASRAGLPTGTASTAREHGSASPGQHGPEGDEDVEETVYCLNGSDSLDITVEFMGAAAASATTTTTTTAAAGKPNPNMPKPAVTAPFVIQYFSSHRRGDSAPSSAATAADRLGAHSAGSCVSAHTTTSGHRVAASDLRPAMSQCVTLRVPLSSVDVRCTPTSLWFKPGQLIHDGRPQPTYPQTVKLFNHGKVPAAFDIVPRSAAAPATALVTGHSPRTQAAMLPRTAPTFKIKEVMHMPDGPCLSGSAREASTQPSPASPYAFATVKGDAAAAAAATATLKSTFAEGERQPDALTHFAITPQRGVIPAATRGGEPGWVVIEVSFTEFSNVRYEDAFEVWVDGEPTGTTFTVRGDSRETEL